MKQSVLFVLKNAEDQQIVAVSQDVMKNSSWPVRISWLSSIIACVHYEVGYLFT